LVGLVFLGYYFILLYFLFSGNYQLSYLITGSSKTYGRNDTDLCNLFVAPCPKDEKSTTVVIVISISCLGRTEGPIVCNKNSNYIGVDVPLRYPLNVETLDNVWKF
jgi:hypothetical protein